MSFRKDTLLTHRVIRAARFSDAPLVPLYEFAPTSQTELSKVYKSSDPCPMTVHVEVVCGGGRVESFDTVWLSPDDDLHLEHGVILPKLSAQQVAKLPTWETWEQHYMFMHPDDARLSTECGVSSRWAMMLSHSSRSMAKLTPEPRALLCRLVGVPLVGDPVQLAAKLYACKCHHSTLRSDRSDQRPSQEMVDVLNVNAWVSKMMCDMGVLTWSETQKRKLWVAANETVQRAFEPGTTAHDIATKRLALEVDQRIHVEALCMD